MFLFMSFHLNKYMVMNVYYWGVWASICVCVPELRDCYEKGQKETR